MGLVYSYLRFSDPRQAEGHSAERQAAYAARWAAENGMVLDESLTLRDEGLSAFHQRHVQSGALGAFLAAVQEGRIVPGSVLVVEGLDRLSRAEPIQAQAQLAQIVNAGITVVTASDGKRYSREHLKANPMDLVYSLLVMIRAHEESDTKSKRVTASIVKQCQAWAAGTWRGKIRNGKDPQWLRETDTGWELIAERAEALRLAVGMYIDGHSGHSVAERLRAAGVSPLNEPLGATHFYKLIRNPALRGIKRISAGGQDFELADYYPAAIDADMWADAVAAGGSRGRPKGTSAVPHVITGLGITYCGYCGRAMSGQNLFGKVKVPGDRLNDGYRRLLCAGLSYGTGRCPYPTSRSVAPIERALMAYCSDIMNLRMLYGRDRAAPLRAELASLRAKLQEVAAQSERLMQVMLGSDAGQAPAMFTRRALELEALQASVQQEIAQREAQMNSLARNDDDGVHERWRALARGVEDLDYDARLKARQLVADTFERITVYATGVRPDKANPYTDVVLVAKGGVGRMLRVSKRGELLAAEDVDALEAAED